MGEEEASKVVVEEEKTHKAEETPKDATEDKTVIPVAEHKDSDSKPSADEKAIVPVTTPAPAPEPEKKLSGGSHDRDVGYAKVEEEKKIALVKAWEDSEKTKAENKACKKLSAIDSWENSKKASIEAELKKKEEQLEKQKAEYAEKMKNKVAEVHKLAQEKRAMVEAQKGEALLKAEECAAKYRATGHVPKNTCGCF